MDILPAIDLLEGRCVRLYQGDYGQSQVFAENPVEVAKGWVAQGATWLHLVDLEGAKTGEPVNLDLIRRIVGAVDVPVQVGGGVRDRNRVHQLLDLGVKRVIMGTVAIEKPELVTELCQDFPGQVVIGIDAREGKVATRGWLETSEIDAIDLAQRLPNAAAIVYTDIHRDGTLAGPNMSMLRAMAEATDVPIIASGGVSSVTDLLSLLSLEPLGVTGVIVGRALYTGDVSLTDAIRAVGQGRWQDVPPDWGSSALA
jgi:phosphoribosylformimino-5-aminoimidazole carboxamide ribotide isomerase